MNGLQSWDDDIRYQALYTVEDVIINEDDNKSLKKINKKLIDNIEKDKRYNRIYRERLINRIQKEWKRKKRLFARKKKIISKIIIRWEIYITEMCIRTILSCKQ